MGIYVHKFRDAALGDKNWLQASKSYEEAWNAVREFNALRQRES